MFRGITEKFHSIFQKLGGKRRLTEANIAEAVGEVRLALLDADVHYAVVKQFIRRVKEKVLGEDLLRNVSPAQQFTKIVHEELTALMGGDAEPELALGGEPAVLLLCGLQGSGKTTSAAKLAHLLQKEKRCYRPLLAACDRTRPAAVEQLQILAAELDLPVEVGEPGEDACSVARRGLQRAKREGHDLLLVDTAGRHELDKGLMQELVAVRDAVQPKEVLFVANASLGQASVNVAAAFNENIPITGTILTMLDGSARGGAAVSIREVTGCPLKFEGHGERVTDFRFFHPRSMADRILGMGDTINLVKEAEGVLGQEESEEMKERILNASFTYEDYLKQVQAIKKLGSFKRLLGMIPGASSMNLEQFDEKGFFKVEAIIQSMTPAERRGQSELGGSRRRRIAAGSGTDPTDVARLSKGYRKIRDMMRKKGSKKQVERMLGGATWR